MPVYVYTTEALDDIAAKLIAQEHTVPNRRDFFIVGLYKLVYYPLS